MFKKSVIVILALFMSVHVALAQYNVNFKKVKLVDFVKFVSEFTGRNFVYDPAQLRGTVTIESKTTMTQADIMQILKSVLEINGLAMIDRGDYIQIVRKASLRTLPYNEVVSSPEKGKTEDFITAVIQLRNISARSIYRTLMSMKSRYGTVEVINGLNLIVARDLKSRVSSFYRVVGILEAKAANMKIRSFLLKNATASKVLRNIRDFFIQLRKQSLAGIQPVLIADDNANIIIAAGTENDLDKIQYLISKFDVSTASVSNAPVVFYLKNAEAKDVYDVVNSLLRSISKKKTVSTRVTYDKSTNSIIFIGDRETAKKIKQLIEKLDIPRKQVFVESLILETSLDNLNKFGIEWLAGGGGHNFAGTVGYINQNGNLVNFETPILEGKPPNLAALPGGFTGGVLGNVVTYEGVKFPTLGALVNAIKNASGINILSNPEILTLDNKPAMIFVGENRPFVTSKKFDTNNNPIETYDYRDVGVKLKVDPHISSDDTITMKIDLEVKKVLANAVSGSTPAPITLTRETNTYVKLKDGSIMVISGLIRNDSNITRTSVPVLSDIPILGWLFKSRSTSTQKTDLIVFITAKVIRNQKEANRLTLEKRKQANKFKKEVLKGTIK